MNSDEHEPINRPDDPFEAAARAAGGELRRPAPADGLARVERARRRQATRRVAGGALGVLALLAGTAWLVGRDDPGSITPATNTTASPTLTTDATSTVASSDASTTTEATGPAALGSASNVLFASASPLAALIDGKIVAYSATDGFPADLRELTLTVPGGATRTWRVEVDECGNPTLGYDQATGDSMALMGEDLFMPPVQVTDASLIGENQADGPVAPPPASVVDDLGPEATAGEPLNAFSGDFDGDGQTEYVLLQSTAQVVSPAYLQGWIGLWQPGGVVTTLVGELGVLDGSTVARVAWLGDLDGNGSVEIVVDSFDPTPQQQLIDLATGDVLVTSRCDVIPQQVAVDSSSLFVVGSGRLLGALVDGQFVSMAHTYGPPAEGTELTLVDRTGVEATYRLLRDSCGASTVVPVAGGAGATPPDDGLLWSVGYPGLGTSDGTAEPQGLDALQATLAARGVDAARVELVTPSVSLDADPELETLVLLRAAAVDASSPYLFEWVAVWHPSTAELTTVYGPDEVSGVLLRLSGDGPTDVNGDGMLEGVIVAVDRVVLMELATGAELALAPRCPL